MNGYVNRVLWVVPNKDLAKCAIADVKKMSNDLDCTEFSNLTTGDYFKSGIVFVTYTLLSSAPNQAKVRDWMGEDYDGMVRSTKMTC